jgi:hypothetical protein
LADNSVITSPHTFPVGTTTVTASASNDCKTVTCNFTVTVNDDENPTITCPIPAAFYYANSGCTWTGAGLDAVIADNCSTPVLSYSINSGSFEVGNANGYAFPMGTTNVVYKVTDASGNTDECNFTITVRGVTLSGVIKYNNTANTPMSNTTITLQQGGVNVHTFTTDALNGNYIIEDVCPGDYQVIFNTAKPAGGINATDAAQVNAWQVEPYPIDKVRFLAGEVSGVDPDGSLRIKSNDAALILDQFITKVPFIPLWEFWKVGDMVSDDTPVLSEGLKITIPSPTVNPSVTQNFLALVSGDFNQNFVPDILKSAAGSESLTLLQGESVDVLPFATVDLPITAGSAMEVGAISLILNYPADKLQVEGVYLQNNPDQPVLYNAKDGELRIGWHSLNPIALATGEVMLTVRLKATTNMYEGDVSRFELAINTLSELADKRYEVIQNAILKMDGLKLEKNVTDVITIPYGSVEMKLTSYPNPFREDAIIKYTLPQAGHVSLEVISIVGSRVKLLSDQQQDAGEYLMNLDGNNLVPGVYQVTLRFKNQYGKELTKTIRMVKQ